MSQRTDDRVARGWLHWYTGTDVCQGHINYWYRTGNRQTVVTCQPYNVEYRPLLSKRLVIIYQCTRCHIAEDGNVYQHSVRTLKCCNKHCATSWYILYIEIMAVNRTSCKKHTKTLCGLAVQVIRNTQCVG
jgi:hypothetical protein